MKKLILIIILLIPIKCFAISAEHAIVMDMDSERILYCKNCEEENLIASTTKIMTAIIALEYSNIQKEITVSNEVLKAYGSAIYISVGEKLTIEDLLYGLMLRSGNDAAIEIATHVTGSMESFAYLMNAYAKKIGMNNTYFINNHGLENEKGQGNTSTATDLAILMSHAMKNDIFKEITSTETYTVKTNYQTYQWHNKNKLLDLYEYTTGGKTGYTEKANRTLVTSAKKDGKSLVIVTLNDGNDFNNHKNLYEEYFNKYQLVDILNKEDSITEEDFFIKNNYSSLITKDEYKNVNTKVTITKKEYLNNDKVGYIEVYINEKKIHEEPIYYIENQKKELTFFEKIIEFLKFW